MSKKNTRYIDHERDACARRGSQLGKGELWIVVGIALAITIGMVVVVLRLIDQTSSHVSKVKDTRVSLEKLNFSPEFIAIEKQVRSDLKNRPNMREVSYGKLDLSKKCFRYIGKMKKLKVLDLSDANFDADWLGELKNLQLEQLNLQNTGLTDKGLEAISKIRTLVRLNASYSEVTDAGLLFLKDHPALYELKLEFSNVTNEGAKTLVVMPALVQVNLYGTHVDGPGIATLANKANLTSISIGGRFVKFAPADLRPLRQVKTLQGLELDNFKMSDELMAEVAGFRNIHSLNLMRSTLSDTGLMKLATMKQLRNLKLDRCANVTPDAIEALKKKMKNCVFQIRTQADINSTT